MFAVNRCMSKRQTRNCKNDDTCTDLNGLFRCTNGLCENITSAYVCTYQPPAAKPLHGLNKTASGAAGSSAAGGSGTGAGGEEGRKDCTWCDCTRKRNCITLEGLYECTDAKCAKVKHFKQAVLAAT